MDGWMNAYTHKRVRSLAHPSFHHPSPPKPTNKQLPKWREVVKVRRLMRAYKVHTYTHDILSDSFGLLLRLSLVYGLWSIPQSDHNTLRTTFFRGVSSVPPSVLPAAHKTHTTSQHHTTPQKLHACPPLTTLHHTTKGATGRRLVLLGDHGLPGDGADVRRHAAAGRDGGRGCVLLLLVVGSMRGREGRPCVRPADPISNALWCGAERASGRIA